MEKVLTIRASSQLSSFPTKLTLCLTTLCQNFLCLCVFLLALYSPSISPQPVTHFPLSPWVPFLSVLSTRNFDEDDGQLHYKSSILSVRRIQRVSFPGITWQQEYFWLVLEQSSVGLENRRRWWGSQNHGVTSASSNALIQDNYEGTMRKITIHMQRKNHRSGNTEEKQLCEHMGWCGHDLGCRL